MVCHTNGKSTTESASERGAGDICVTRRLKTRRLKEMTHEGVQTLHSILYASVLVGVVGVMTAYGLDDQEIMVRFFSASTRRVFLHQIVQIC